MENNVLLGSIDNVAAPVANPSGSSSSPIVITTGPVDMVTLPTDDQSSGSFNYLPGGPAGGGGDIGIDFRGDVPVDKPVVGGGEPPEVRERWMEESKKRKQKTMIALGIGGLVLAYLLFRKK